MININKCTRCGHIFNASEQVCPVCGSGSSEFVPVEAEFNSIVARIAQVKDEVGKVIKGKDDIIEKVLMAMFASGNILLEDNPGTGKTTLAKTLANVIELDYRRQQFNPDTMPSDILGYTFYDKKWDEQKYVEGVVWCNLLLADEINRTSAKTQAALLEAMEEKHVTIDGVTRKLPEPFIVIATQNPNTSMGTQPLPDSQCDRFIIKISMGYPNIADEAGILLGSKVAGITGRASRVMNKDEFLSICAITENIYVHERMANYIARLAAATRSNRYLEVGLSTRGAIALLRMARAGALMSGRDYVVPQDVKRVFVDVAGHRVVLSTAARMDDKDVKEILESILKEVAAEDATA